MAKGSSTRTRLWLAGPAAAGVVVSHWLAYWWTVRDSVHRHEVLLATGHRYWSLVVAAALGLLVAGLARFIRVDPAGGRIQLTSTVVRLSFIQVFGFLVLEAGERLPGSGSLENVLTEPAVVAGVVAQFLIAALCAVLLVAFATAVRFVRGALSSAVRARSALSVGSPREPLFGTRFRVGAGAGTLRGPPL